MNTFDLGVSDGMTASFNKEAVSLRGAGQTIASGAKAVGNAFSSGLKNIGGVFSGAGSQSSGVLGRITSGKALATVPAGQTIAGKAGGAVIRDADLAAHAKGLGLNTSGLRKNIGNMSREQHIAIGQKVKAGDITPMQARDVLRADKSQAAVNQLKAKSDAATAALQPKKTLMDRIRNPAIALGVGLPVAGVVSGAGGTVNQSMGPSPINQGQY